VHPIKEATAAKVLKSSSCCPTALVLELPLDTSSFYSIVNCKLGLRLIGATGGRLSMLPLSLKLVEQEVPAGSEKNLNFKTLEITASWFAI